MARDTVLILDLGGNSAQNIARKIRSEKVYCEVVPPDYPAEEVSEQTPGGLVLAGNRGAASDLVVDPGIWSLGVPILGIGSGARAVALAAGARLTGEVLDDHLASVDLPIHPLFDKASGGMRRIAHADGLALPESMRELAAREGIPICFADDERRLYGVQFIPEQNDPDGNRILANFAVKICGCRPSWVMSSFIDESVAAIRAQVGEGHALLGISGGIDSAVCSALMHRALGMRLHCLFIDTGLMRKGERAEVERVFRDQLGIDLRCIDAATRFIDRLRGVIDPSEKRRIIAEEFLTIFEEQAARLGAVEFLVQGTNYTDVLEAGLGGGQKIKSHHTINWMPQNLRFNAVIEPVRLLFKEEVRVVGEMLELPASLVWRQPFPGSGLAVRCIGEVTRDKLDTLREVDQIFRSEVAGAGIERQIGQYFAVLTHMHAAGDGRAATIALRAVHKTDSHSASAFRIPFDLIDRTVRRIIGGVPGVSRVVYDFTPFPPASVEWE